MSEWQKVVIEADAKGRVSINAVDADGAGEGYRLAGPKYVGDRARLIAKCVLDKEDVDQIRWYLAIWDAIQERKAEEAA